jgi:HK97 family phage portal protein
MTVILSRTSLLDMPANWWPPSVGGSINLYNDYAFDYAALYKSQPNVRVCVDFLARNIAQLGLHVFRREMDNDRTRLRDHPLSRLIERPMPAQYKTSRYRLIECLMGDMGVYFNAYWLKQRVEGQLIGLMRIPPQLVTVYGNLYPTAYEVNFGGAPERFDPEEIVHFRGYNAENASMGLSPLETLRRILAEEHASGDYREGYWKNAARMSGFIQRPREAPDWSTEARARFKSEFEALYAGTENSGKTAILEEGMEWKQASFNPKESEYLEGRKLTREECARAYHIPPPLVGILEHATYSNIEHQSKMLYTDVLGPWLSMIEQEITLQLLDDFDDTENVYVEFNIQEKMQGNFEQQTKALQSAIGRPWMTPNEGRGIMNLSRIEDGDELVTPLNVIMGGQANPRDSAPKSKSIKAAFSTDEPGLRDEFEAKWRRLLVKTFKRQQDAILPKLKSNQQINALWEEDRWNTEVTEDFIGLSMLTAVTWGKLMAGKFGSTFSEDELTRYIQESARLAATYINQNTRDQIAEALLEEDPKSSIQKLFELAIAVRAVQFAISRVTALSQYGGYKAAVQGGLVSKTWVVTSGNPRDSHAGVNGETVGIRERFSNGLRYPGDYSGGAEENANCQCVLVYNRGD